MTKVTFEPFTEACEQKLQFAVIVARFKDKWVFVRHNKRNTFEIPGGSRELHEKILFTARRELFEETGARTFRLTPVCVYVVSKAGVELGRGLLCYSEIVDLGELPPFEISSVHLLDGIPESLTYPDIQPYLFHKIQEWLHGN
ncbi:NUDIX domain-containing protein [Candidatus Babeliales bacterium]|nr:NUDIX domain-containing protein [Candidatus Babeliales bacterium]